MRVNGIALGMFPSEMTLGASNAATNESEYDVEQFRTGIKAFGVDVLERMGSAGEVGSVSVFFFSSLLS